jgi:hypothetical protein
MQDLALSVAIHGMKSLSEGMWRRGVRAEFYLIGSASHNGGRVAGLPDGFQDLFSCSLRHISTAAFATIPSLMHNRQSAEHLLILESWIKERAAALPTSTRAMERDKNQTPVFIVMKKLAFFQNLMFWYSKPTIRPFVVGLTLIVGLTLAGRLALPFSVLPWRDRCQFDHNLIPGQRRINNLRGGVRP